MIDVLTNFFDREGNQAVINIDVASSLNNLSDVLVVKPQNFLITFVHVLVIQCDLDFLSLLEFNLSSATLRPQRRSFDHFACDRNLYIFCTLL